ncbi:MAG TPA: PEGA domain-containing protein [Longimicrobium sp.]
MRKSVAVLASLMMAGCATIMQGSKQQVGISSTPSGATIFVDSQQVGTTPATVPLARKRSHTVRLELAGYQPYEIALSRKTSGWVWGNLVFGGLPGLAVDAITGGLYKLTPEDVQGTLATRTAMNDVMTVRVVLSADPSWEKIGQLARR